MRYTLSIIYNTKETETKKFNTFQKVLDCLELARLEEEYSGAYCYNTFTNIKEFEE